MKTAVGESHSILLSNSNKIFSLGTNKDGQPGYDPQYNS